MTAKKHRKIREYRAQSVGFAGRLVEARVFEAPADYPLPDGAEYVDDDTPCCDWQPVQGVN